MSFSSTDIPKLFKKLKVVEFLFNSCYFFQEVFQLVIAVEWNGDEMSPINIIGLCVCLGGIVCHVVHKIHQPTMKVPDRNHYMEDMYDHEIGENLINGELYVDTVSVSSDDEKSDTDILFDILNRHER